jgi:hypothetical protein
VLCEIWASGTQLYYLPSRHWNFRFPEITTRKVRLVQTATTTNVWAISEVRIFSSEGEIQRQAHWRVRASVNPWDVQLAFDNCPTTRWKAWEQSKPEMFLEIDFGTPLRLTGVEASISGDNPETAGRVDAETSSGRWQPLSAHAEETEAPQPVNSRRNAMEDIKRFGITHLVVDRSEFLSVDMFRNQATWGIVLIGETDRARLYRID